MASELLAPPSLGSLSDLSSRFDGLAARIRRVALLRGLGRVVLVTAALCALGLVVDWLWPLPNVVRMVWLGLILGVLGFSLWTQVFRPVFRKFTIAELAAIVETQYPELGERLTSAIELTDPGIPEDHKGSALMREYLEAETLSSTRHLDFRKAVSTERAQKSAWVGGAAALVLFLPFLVMPTGYGPLWNRLVMPWGSHELPAVLYFHVPEGTRVVARGEDLTLLALPPDDVAVEELPDTVELVWTSAQGETHHRPMEYVADQQGFVATLPHVFEDFEYIVTAKRKRSERHTITVVDRPEITGLLLVITPPAYTGLAEQRVDGAIGDVIAFERSRVKAVLEFNKPLADAKWLWRESTPNADGNTQVASKPTALPFQLSEDKKSATLELLASEGSFTITARDEHGLSNLAEPPRKLIILADQPPELTLLDEGAAARARREDVYSLVATAKDDVAVTNLELHLETSKGQTQVRTIPPDELGGPEANGHFDLDLAALDLADGDSLTYRVRAADNRPVPGPNEVWSEERRIVIDPNAPLPGSKDVTERQTELRDILEAIRKDLKQNLAETEQLRKEAKAKEAKGQVFDKQNELANLENGQREIADRLEELANRFGQNRLLANLTPETQRIAREPVHEAAEELQKAQEQDQIDKQTETLEKTEEALSKADEDLKKLADRFEELAELERDLMVVSRLAQQAERVAEQALELAKRRDNPPAGETAEQQAAREATLEQEQALVEEERQRLADGLDELLNRRPEVLDAARKSALEQIAELSQAAAKLADRQDLLTESLKSDAQEAAKAAAPIADKQAELLKKAEAIGTAKPKETDPITPVDPEALRKALEELKAGNLDAALEQQENVADRLESLAAELKKNQELPDDPKQAAAELAKRQRELQEQLDEAAKNQPAENAKAEDKQAFDNTLRELAEKQTGIQAGIAQLEAPAPNREQQQQALDQAAKAVENLIKGDPEKAAKNADEAAKALDKLAKNIGTPEDRAAQAKEAIETLRKQQQELKQDTSKAVEEKSDMEELAKRQQDLADRLAQVDTLEAEESLLDALRQSVQAKNDLEKERLQDVEHSQALAEQTLADLESKLDGKPSAREEVEQLKDRQQDIAKQTANENDPAQLAEVDQAQQEVVDRLKNLDAPAAEAERQAAENAAKRAAESLGKSMTPEQTQTAVAQAAKALDQLEKALAPQSPKNAAEEVANRQDQAAEAASQAAKNAQKNQVPPTPADRQQQAEQLAQRTEDVKDIPAGEAGQREKEEALEALEKAKEAQEELEELIKQQEQNAANNPNAQPKPEDKEDLERLMQDNADVQKKAAEALERLQQELAKKENQEKLHNELNEAQEKAEQLAEENQPKENADQPNLPQPEDVEQLAEEARAIEEEIEQLKQEIAGTDQEERNQPQQSAQSEPISAENPQRANDQAQSNPDKNNQQANASRPNDSGRNPSEPKNSDPNGSDPKGSDPNNSDANNSRPNQSPAPMPGENPQENSPAPESANDGEPMPAPSENGERRQNGEQQPGNTSEQNGSRPNQERAEQSGQSLTDRQAELAKKSAELALKVAQDQGAESQATKAAADAARKADQAREEAQDGALDRAAKSAQEAADAANAAAQELEQNPANAQEPNELAKDASQQASAQSQLAKELAEAAANPAQRRAAQEAGQQSLAESSEKIAQGLSEAAKRLNNKPLDMTQSGEKTASAGESAGNAAEEMQEAKSNAANGNAAQAASAGEKASEALRQAAEQTPMPPKDTPKNTLVPGDLAGQVAEARRRLEEAKWQLESARKEPMPPPNVQAENDPPMPGSDSEEQAPGNSGDPMMGQSNPGQSANAQNQPGQQSPMGQQRQPMPGQQGQPMPGQQGQAGQPGQQGQGQPSALAQSAQSLQEAAKSLSQAAQQLQGGAPGQGKPSNSSAHSANSTPGQGQPSENGSEGPGAQGEFPLEALEAELKRQNREAWGQLPGQLRTEILQGNKQKTEGDYARLIKLYSEELLKKQQDKQGSSNP